MSETKFTKGPWNVHGLWPDDVVDSGGALVAGARGDYEFPQTQANAHLIASAPELYEALEACMEWERDYRTRNHLGTATPHPFAMAEAALKKARGEK